MAQHDYVIANGTGAAVRSDLNNALAAIVSQNSGATAPSPTYAYQFWADTTTGLLKLRNAANSAWITLFQLDGEWSTLPVENGTAAAPSIYFKDSGTDTGFYSPGTDQIGISTGGTARLTIDANGNVAVDTNTLYVDAPNNRVGIGASSPAVILDVRGDSGVQFSPTTNNTNAQLELTARNGSAASAISRLSSISEDSGTAAASFAISTRKGTTGVITEALRIDSAQRVGIGTASPQAQLDVRGANLADDTYGNVNIFTTEAATTNYGGSIALGGGTTGGTSPYVCGKIKGARDGASTYSGYLSFLTMSTGSVITERMRLDNSGRLLVGTSTSIQADCLVQSSKTSGNSGILVNSDSLSNNQASFIQIRGTVGSTTRFAESGVFKNSSLTNGVGYLYLQEEDGGDAWYWTDSSGNFRISNTVSNIGTTGGTVVGTQTSDERLKNILGPVEYGLETIKQIEPVRYALKSEPDIEKLGFIAQQVQPLIPQSIFDTKEHIEGEPEDAPTKMGMEYVTLIPVLVNAIKELSAEVDALKAQLQTQ